MEQKTTTSADDGRVPGIEEVWIAIGPFRPVGKVVVALGVALAAACAVGVVWGLWRIGSVLQLIEQIERNRR